MAVGVALLTGSIVLSAEYLVPWTTDSVPVCPCVYVPSTCIHVYSPLAKRQ